MSINHVIYLSVIPFDGLYQRPQALANAFSDLGLKVTYITQLPLHRGYKAVNKVSGNINFKTIITISQYFAHLFKLDLKFIKKFELQSIIDLLDEETLVIFGGPIWAFSIDSISQKCNNIVYDCYDDWGLLMSGHRLNLNELENIIVLNSTLAAVTTSSLQDKLTKIRPDLEVIYLPNAVEIQHFKAGIGKGEKRRKQLGITGPVAGFFGAIYDWVDEGLLWMLAKELPHVLFILCGPVVDFNTQRLQSLSNVMFTGMIPYEFAPEYIDMFDVALVPYRPIKRMETVNSNKFYQYLALGKPIVTIKMPSVEEFGELMLVADNSEDFLIKLKEAFSSQSHSMTAQSNRLNFAAANSWTTRASKLLQHFIDKPNTLN